MRSFSVLTILFLLTYSTVCYAIDFTLETFKGKEEGLEQTFKAMEEMPVKVSYQIETYHYYQTRDPKVEILSTNGDQVEFTTDQGKPNVFINGEPVQTVYKGVKFIHPKEQLEMIRVTGRKRQETYFLSDDYVYRNFSLGEKAAAAGCYQQFARRDGEIYYKNYSSHGKRLNDFKRGKEAEIFHHGPEFDPRKFLTTKKDVYSWMSKHLDDIQPDQSGKIVTQHATVTLDDNKNMYIHSHRHDINQKISFTLYYEGKQIFNDQQYPTTIYVGSKDINTPACWSRITNIKLETIPQKELHEMLVWASVDQ